MTESLEPRYDHKAVEEKIYKIWEESGYFNPDNLPVAKTQNLKPKTFCLVMPPPNANGSLHIGHAVFVTLQDIMTRFARMRGRKTLWLPGADHAGFETQVVFDKKLEKEGRSRFSSGGGSASGGKMTRAANGEPRLRREEVWKEIWDFTQANKIIMENQLRKLGASCDWSREKFTLDQDIISEVQKTFIKLYEDGFVYRDLRVVNWCAKHKTALSDLEVKYVEREDPLYYIKYGPLTLATVRPETKFGDTALAVNPKDKRYQKYIGKVIEAQGVLGPLKFKVIGDDAVDAEFGTGVVKVTPAHDSTDFEIWTRHKDEIPGPKIIIDENGRLTGPVGEFAGLKVAEARIKVADAMERAHILEKIDPKYVHQVATCYKCGSTLEPRPLPQWFVKMQPLAKPAIAVVQAGKIKFYPDRIKKVYFHWLKNIRDWNISRQIVWGIRIPAWFHEPKCIPRKGHEGDVVKCRDYVVSIAKPKCEFCDAEFVQDADVFDTWFSSGQWPFLTLGFTESQSSSNSKFKVKNEKLVKSDFKEFYPTDVMETAYDILFFWVARMIMFGLYRTGKIPFKNVYIHGLVRDKDRQKMSKSKGNVIDPLGIAETYGADAVRMALVVGNTAGNDIVISEDKIRGYRNFATKIWNVARFVLMNKPITNYRLSAISKEDKKNLAELRKIKAGVTRHIEKYEFHLAAEKIYHYFWHTFADKIIEGAKPRLMGNDAKERAAAYSTLETILTESLKMLHPFMPFVTEEIFGKLHRNKMLMTEKW
ncbi:MAG: valine--tRNA ligase [bacterium]|nr:valine--tRNA ligase [bacterium]